VTDKGLLTCLSREGCCEYCCSQCKRKFVTPEFTFVGLAVSMPGPSPLNVKRSDSGLGIPQVPTEGQPGFKRTRKREILPMQTMSGITLI
jgi:hypothetical protein